MQDEPGSLNFQFLYTRLAVYFFPIFYPFSGRSVRIITPFVAHKSSRNAVKNEYKG